MSSYRGYSGETAAWLESVDAIRLRLGGELADIMSPMQAMKLADELAPALASSRLSGGPHRKAATALIRKSAPRVPHVPRGMVFCPNEKQAVRLRAEKTMRMGGLIGTCPLCAQLHYRES